MTPAFAAVPAMAETSDEARKRELARIHCLKKDLRLDDQNYRHVLWAVARVDSAKDLDSFGRKAVITHMEAHLKPRQPSDAGAVARAERAAADKQPLMYRIARLVNEAGKSVAYVDGMSRKMFGIEQYQWCTPEQLTRLAAALAIHARRAAPGATACAQ